MKTLLFAVVLLFPTIAFANSSLCKQKSGALYLRTKCLKGESALSQTTLANLGIATTTTLTNAETTASTDLTNFETSASTALTNLQTSITNSIVNYKACHSVSFGSSSCTVDTNSVAHCEFSCTTSEFILTAAATTINPINYSTGSFLNQELINGLPYTEEFDFYKTAAGDFSLIGTCCPHPSTT